MSLPKPRLTPIDYGRWCCGRGGFNNTAFLNAFGDTPRQAYRNWLEFNSFKGTIDDQTYRALSAAFQLHTQTRSVLPK